MSEPTALRPSQQRDPSPLVLSFGGELQAPGQGTFLNGWAASVDIGARFSLGESGQIEFGANYSPSPGIHDLGPYLSIATQFSERWGFSVRLNGGPTWWDSTESRLRPNPAHDDWVNADSAYQDYLREFDEIVALNEVREAAGLPPLPFPDPVDAPGPEPERNLMEEIGRTDLGGHLTGSLHLEAQAVPNWLLIGLNTVHTVYLIPNISPYYVTDNNISMTVPFNSTWFSMYFAAGHHYEADQHSFLMALGAQFSFNIVPWPE